MKTILLVLVVFSTSFLAYTQQNLNTDVIICETNSQLNTAVWATYFENDTIRIEYKFSDCDPSSGFDFEGVLIKVSNLTEVKLDIAWHKFLYYAGVCRTCAYPEEYRYEFCLSPNQVVEGDCSTQSGYNLKLFSRFIDPQYSQGDKLTQFQLGDLTITEK